jgi:hypothetical protein
MCFRNTHEWIEPTEAVKRKVIELLLSCNKVQWLHIEKINVCSKCQRVKVTGSSFLKSFETIIIDQKELKAIVSKKEREEQQEYMVIADYEKVTIPNP